MLWAKDYKVDGFRFDLMGHASKANMLAIRSALDALTLAKDGVDGKAIYLYGEGWNFGEVANNALFEQATQGQLGGTGIGTFTDRLRDAVNGGSPVSADALQVVVEIGDGIAGLRAVRRIGVEVRRGVQARVVVLGPPGRTAIGGAALLGHVVDHRVDDDLHTRRTGRLRPSP